MAKLRQSVAFCIEWAPIVILDLADGRSKLKFVSTVVVVHQDVK